MMKRELLECPKERAEHLMLVDLERNDMTMFCEPGSVSRTSFCIETYADVHHLVSEVEGTLRNDKNIWDALQSMFPGGSISGCPKTVTIAAIDQLEGESRSFWTGSMGILDYETRSLSLNIMIRTLEANKNGSAWNGTVQAGGGLVIGSEPSTEVEEAKWKAAALRRSAGWISRQGENSTELSDLSVEMIETEVGQAGEPDRIGDILRWPDIPAASSRTVAFIDNLDSFSWNIANSLALEGANVVMVPGRMQSSPGLDEMLEIIQPTHVVIGPGPGVPENSPLSMQAARCALKGEMPPVLGVCLGHQALGVSCGWPLVENRSGAVHGEPCELEPAGEGLCDATGPMTRYHSLVLDPSADQMANSELDVTQWDAGGLGLIMALRHKRHPVHAVQYHPESVESEGGQSIFRAFLQL